MGMFSFRQDERRIEDGAGQLSIVWNCLRGLHPSVLSIGYRETRTSGSSKGPSRSESKINIKIRAPWDYLRGPFCRIKRRVPGLIWMSVESYEVSNSIPRPMYTCSYDVYCWMCFWLPDLRCSVSIEEKFFATFDSPGLHCRPFVPGYTYTLRNSIMVISISDLPWIGNGLDSELWFGGPCKEVNIRKHAVG